MDDPTPPFKAIHDEAIQANTPLDAFIQKQLRAQEGWLKRWDGEHFAQAFTTAINATLPAAPWRASIPFANLASTVLEVRPGASKVQCLLSCLVTSAENPGEAGIDYKIEIPGLASATGSISPHTPTNRWHDELIELAFDEPTNLNLVLPVFVWFKSQLETSIHIDSLTISSTTADYGTMTGTPLTMTDPGLYTIEQLDSDDNVVWRYDLYDTQADQLFFAHPMIDATNQPARVRALGYVGVGAVSWRVIYDGVDP